MSRWTENRRIVEDRRAGLMFGWRGREALHGRTLLAIVLGSAIFGLLVLLIRVEGSQQAIGFREAGRLTVLTPESEASRRWLSWAHEKAPDLDRWEPKLSAELDRRISGFENVLERESRFEALLHPAEPRSPESKMPTIINPLRRNLPVAASNPELPPMEGRVKGRLVLEVTGGIEDRWKNPPSGLSVEGLLRNRLEEEEDVRFRDLLGLDRRFLISVDSEGRIQTCQVLNPEEKDLDGLLGRWLRLQQLLPGTKEISWGRIRIQVEGLREIER